MMFMNSVPERGTCSPGVLVPTVGLWRVKETAWPRAGESWHGVPCSTKGSQQPMHKKETLPKLSLLLYLGHASKVTHDQFLGY